jgi:hypothetical protein
MEGPVSRLPRDGVAVVDAVACNVRTMSGDWCVLREGNWTQFLLTHQSPINTRMTSRVCSDE